MFSLFNNNLLGAFRDLKIEIRKKLLWQKNSLGFRKEIRGSISNTCWARRFGNGILFKKFENGILSKNLRDFV